MHKLLTNLLCALTIVLFIPACSYEMLDQYWIENDSSKVLRITYTEAWTEDAPEEELLIGPFTKSHLGSFHTSFSCQDLGPDFLTTNFVSIDMMSVDSAEMQLTFTSRNNWSYHQKEVKNNCSNIYTLTILDSYFE